MAETLPSPEVPFTKEFSPYGDQNKPEISSEDIRARLHKVNEYFDRNIPSVIKGMNKYEEDLLDKQISIKKPSSFDAYSKLPDIQNEYSGNILTGNRALIESLDLPTFDKIQQYTSKVNMSMKQR